MSDYFSHGATDLVRIAIAKSNGRDQADALSYAKGRWGKDAAVVDTLQKALVGGAEVPAVTALGNDLRSEVARFSAFDRIAYRRMLGPKASLARSSRSAVAYVVSEGDSIPLSRLGLTWEKPAAIKLAALVVTSAEVLETADAETLNTLRADLVAAVADATDTVFLPVLLNDSETVVLSAGGTIQASVEAAVAAFGGDLRRATWITDGKTAAKLGAVYEGPSIDGNGTLLGRPLLVSPGVTADSDGGQIMLVAGEDILFRDDGITVAVSREATIEQRDDPTGNVLGPAGVTTAGLTSLFQEDAAALKAVRRFGALPSPGSVVVVVGV